MSSGIFAVHVPGAAQGEVVRFIRATLAYKRCHLRASPALDARLRGHERGESVARMERSGMRGTHLNVNPGLRFAPSGLRLLKADAGGRRPKRCRACQGDGHRLKISFEPERGVRSGGG